MTFPEAEGWTLDPPVRRLRGATRGSSLPSKILALRDSSAELRLLEERMSYGTAPSED
jgi:hypothetical protein